MHCFRSDGGIDGANFAGRLLDPSQSCPETAAQRPYFVVRTYDGLVAKRAGRNESGGEWLLESYHPVWEPAHWPDDAETIGEVRWMARVLSGY